MERKIYIVENIDCANCAAKIEAKFNALPEVEEAVLTFATKQLRITAEDPDSLIEKLTEIARTVEGGAVIRAREKHQHRHEHHHECGCGHHHEEHHHDCGCGHHHEEHHCDCGCGHHHEEHHHECSCGHHHEEHHECGCSHHHEEHHECGCGHHHEEHHHECGCGHHHEEHHECGCGHHHEEHEHDHGSDEKKSIFLGAGLFAAGLVLNGLGLKIPGWLAFLAAYGVLGWEIVLTAFRNLKKGHVLDENFLMSIASIGAFCIGEAPEAVGVILFYRVGEYFEHKALERSRSQIMEAIDLRPEVVHLASGETIPAEDAEVGDILIVRPGDRIPLDGIVLSGESRIDTAPITGEPVPVAVAPGSGLISGCVNTTGQLTMRVEKELSESMVTRILDSVENAAASKPKIDRFITRFAKIYTPIVVALAALVAIVPSLVTGNWNYWVYTALSFLVMSCPCALVLSVPLAFFAGIGTGSRQGILFKGGVSIEAMEHVKAVVMDKTGTVTRGEFKVQTIGGGLDVLKLCASCEQQSTHPIAVSIVSAAKERNMELFTPDSLEEIPGRGIRAKVDGKTVLCGNEQLLAEHHVEFGTLESDGSTRVLVAVDNRFAGFITIADGIKEGAKRAIDRLKQDGMHTVMLTGDAELPAKAVAKEVGIEETHAKLLPQEKLEKLQMIRAKKGSVMFVGDGINDAPVLAGADVGAAMGSGADAAIEAADVVFMRSDVRAIPEALTIARRTGRIARQNVIFALAIKFAVMILGLLGHASMWMAVFADSGVAMLCVLNSIRMLYQNTEKREK